MIPHQISDLYRLSQNRSIEGRRLLAGAVSDLFSGEGMVLSDKERAIATDILRQLVHSAEVEIRKALAEHLAGQPLAPVDLVMTLAGDQILVAEPVLRFSALLGDAELVALIRKLGAPHQLVIAKRSSVGETVTDALIAHGPTEVAYAVLVNPGSKISRNSVLALTRAAQRETVLRRPLLARAEMPPDLAARLYWWAGAELRRFINSRFTIDSQQLDGALKTVLKELAASSQQHRDALPEQIELADRLAEHQAITPTLLIQTLRLRNTGLFALLLTRLTRLDENGVRAILDEDGGEALALICKALGIDKASFATLFLLGRAVKMGDKAIDPRELSRAMGLYDRLTLEASKKLFQRWQNDSGDMHAFIARYANRSE
ncbi:DUF2336 domain-containing protein [Azospirillaceae bacterium]